MSAPQDSSRPLEDHLRNLILNNAEDAPSDAERQPPNISVTNLTDQPKESSAPLKSAKKRPNQAQRRQMSSQITIDIDPRATGPNSSRPPVGHPGFNRGPLHESHFPPDHHPHGHRGGFQHSHHHWRQHSGRGGIPTRGVNVMQADAFAARPRNSRGGLYNPEGHRQYVVRPEELAAQSELLEQLCAAVVQTSEIEYSEILEKEDFRRHIEAICRAVVSDHERISNGATTFQPQDVQLKCFGSLASGFATKAADMDLGLLSPASQIPPDAPESPVPRLIERALLDAGFGARLLTRTRVPIIKLCAMPTSELRSDLLEERTKWEQGLIADETDFVEEESSPHIETSKAPKEVDKADATAKISIEAAQASEDAAAESEKAQDVSPERLLSSIKQSGDQSLLAYHNQTKKVLRQLGGRDVTHSNFGIFTEGDFLLLSDVSEAFVEGLNDTALKQRVKLHPSFSIGKPVPNHRTLHGVCNMVEGENLVMLWENRAVPDGDARAEQAHAKTVRWWAELHQTRHFGSDPLAFNKEMFVSLERLKKIPSIQLMQLQQDQYESAADYHDRAVKIMAQLSATALAAAEPGVLPPLIQYYVSGIHQKAVREVVKKFVQRTDTKNIRAVARRHRSLHLADEYARALDKGSLYQRDDIPIVKEYIHFLRSEMVPVNSGQVNDYHLPVEESLLHIYDRILQLPNPALSAENQPKDRYHDKLAFPQSGVGVQCDINFSAHLALQNSHLLRCYAATDPRVRPIVLFVKHWAKARDINTPYRGTLSSYGYVLMVMHYLINIAQPFVCPNLQLLTPPDPDLPSEALEGVATCKGRNVRFWRNEQEIQRMSSEGVLNANRESIGHLLRGFFEYYAQNNMMSTTQKRGFDWGRDVISMRTPGGILSKQEKNWVQARTTMQRQMGAPPTPIELDSQNAMKSSAEPQSQPIANPELMYGPFASTDGPLKSDHASKPQELKEVRHRFLFAIEDPFEHEHNVARTVTHHGIVSIRDEFRRAWRIIKLAGKDTVQEDLLENVKAHAQMLERKQFADLLAEIHGNSKNLV
ncbi:hypothetical protein BKA67DRAFT_509134 [Truncatella angustata]|uniref:polynucleotide adenylyltransferase n=1 Tax=Truncatella angustata TaxID=152316 RepID=A0A9P9A2N3_9PEZI|nr:uncharacterized protein BKA67DRAFT_509134 [Truncatella angustata]KAH6659597.1 hypothetical protein BKA67DRAFT_509134 [Truncatella angustata]